MNKPIQVIKEYTHHLMHKRKMIFSLAQNDFKTKYAGSLLGGVWSFVKPIVTILVFWFVFEVGFKSSPVHHFPFILWLVVGIIPWFYFSEAIIGATYSLHEYRYLVRNVKFKVSILPLIKILSSFYVYSFFFGFLFVLFWAYQIPITLYSIQIIYYLFSLMILLMGLSWMTSALSVFLKDIGQMVEVILQILIWLTPILWNYKQTIPKEYVYLLRLNPLFYITDGFRDAFIYHIWFFNKPIDTLIYWGITLTFFTLGGFLFYKLRPHFADVL